MKLEKLKPVKHIDIFKTHKAMEFVFEMTSAERSELPDEMFGLPEKRKYPLDSKKHVLSAIKFFNYCSLKEEKELANNILRAIGDLNIKNINVGKGNRFYRYYNEKL